MLATIIGKLKSLKNSVPAKLMLAGILAVATYLCGTVSKKLVTDVAATLTKRAVDIKDYFSLPQAA